MHPGLVWTFLDVRKNPFRYNPLFYPVEGVPSNKQSKASKPRFSVGMLLEGKSTQASVDTEIW